MLDEILEERVVSSRGRQVPRGVKRKMSGYKLRPRTPQPTVRIDFTAAIRIVRSCTRNEFVSWGLSWHIGRNRGLGSPC